VQRLDAGQPDVEVRLAIEDFSSLLAGTVIFRACTTLAWQRSLTSVMSKPSIASLL